MDKNFGFLGVEAIVFGKGPTFKKIKKEEGQIHVCVNDSINEIDEPDIVVFNDSISLKKIDKNKLKKVKIIVTPYYPHFEQSYRPKSDFTWLNLKELFPELNCLWYPYNLKTSKPVLGIPTFESSITSSNTAVEWCVINGIKKITTYGVGKESGYNVKFTGSVVEGQIKKIRDDIEYRCKINNVELKML